MTTKPDGGHAYPTNAYRYDESGNAIPIVGPGMTLRQYAAIQLRVPDSGLDWLDDMIRARLRDEIAERVMLATVHKTVMPENLWQLIRRWLGKSCAWTVAGGRGVSENGYYFADAMCAEREKRG